MLRKYFPINMETWLLCILLEGVLIILLTFMHYTKLDKKLVGLSQVLGMLAFFLPVVIIVAPIGWLIFGIPE